MEIGDRHVEVESLGLVDRQHHGFAAAARQLRDELVLRRQTPPGHRPARSDGRPRAIARSVCATIRLSIWSASSSTSPPVSTTMQGTSVRRAKPYCRSRVRPGKSATSASRVPVIALNKRRLAHVGPTDQCDYGQHSGRLLRRSGALRSSGLRAATAARTLSRLGGRLRRVSGGSREYAASLPVSVSTTTVSCTATGGLLTRYFATR